MKFSKVRRSLAVSAVIASCLAVPQVASAQTSPIRSAASFADAIGIDVDIALLDGNIPVDVSISEASQEFPPGAQAPADDVVLNPVIPPITGKARTVGAMAGATGLPQGVASAEVEGLQLLMNGQTPVIEADVVRAQANSDCVNDPNAEGTIIVGLKIAGTPVLGPINGLFPPNFQPPTPAREVLAALGLTLIINEQHPSADGRGIVVNGLHLFDSDPAGTGAIFDGDIRVSHASSAVNCPNGRGSTGLATTQILINKVTSKGVARPGEELTYTTTIQNKSTQPCRVNQLIDHLPVVMEFVSTAGQFGTAAELENRDGGGTDVVVKPSGMTIAAGGTATQTFVVKVKADAAPGTYFNNIELLCANLGNFTAIDAPVQVPGAAAPTPRVFQCSDKLDNDKDGKIDFPNDPGCSSPQDDSELNSLPRTGASTTVPLVGMALLIAAAVAVRRFRFTH
ncbi:MAG TPA: hypothetical protein VNA12_07860 [Mycobacteriales bacterium]|nr:hypothetical protein [Mycobacteriales bacterium]